MFYTLIFYNRCHSYSFDSQPRRTRPNSIRTHNGKHSGNASTVALQQQNIRRDILDSINEVNDAWNA